MLHTLSRNLSSTLNEEQTMESKHTSRQSSETNGIIVNVNENFSTI